MGSTGRALKPKVLGMGFALMLLASACSKSTASSGGDSGYSYGNSSTGSATSAEPSDTGSAGETLSIDGQMVAVHGTADASGQTSVKVEADTDDGQNYFSPTVVTGTPGQTVTVQLENASSTVPHNFSVDGSDVNVDLKPSATDSVKVTLPASGSVTFFCEYHRAAGMVGQLSVG